MSEPPGEAPSARIEAVFLAVAGAEGEERKRRLDDLCGEDRGLRDEVLSLLAHHERADGMLDSPAIVRRPEPGLGDRVEASLPPITVAGGYRLRAVLGAGGMGVVYLASQLSTRRTVALKVIRPGVASDGMARRFEHEALLLAKLSHPGIAQVFEAGEADFGLGPQRFIAMEYLDGLDLCDHVEAQQLDVAARLELIARLADATHHAHQRGIIHRDLKPANVLVVRTRDDDPIGQPKILDFGVARVDRTAGDVTSMGTSVGQIVGTLPYMSPEQVVGDGDDIDVRSDVYALGVLCFRVIAGTLPHRFEGASIAEIARIIRDEPPRRVSSIEPSAAGDVEAIVNRALEKDRERRYQSAGELAADIRRSLAHEPIEAHPATTFYYLRKFVRRNRRVAGLALALVVVAAIGAAVSVWFGIEATIARGHVEMALERAERRTQDANESAAQARREAYLASITAASAALAALDGAAATVALEAVEPERRSSWEWRHLARSADAATRKLSAPTSAVYAVDVSPDGSLIVSGSYDRTVRLWNLADGSLRATLEGHERPVWGVAFSPRGDRIASGSADRTLRIWRVDDGAELLRGQGHTGAITSVAWSPDGALVATSSEDGTIRFWDAESATERTDLRASVVRARSVCWNSDGTMIGVAADTGQVTVLKLGRREPIATLEGHARGAVACAFDPSGSTLATGGFDQSCILWDAATWSRRARIDVGIGGVRTLAYSPDGATLALGTMDGQLRLHAAADGATLGVLLGSSGVVSSVAWHPDGMTLVTSTSERTGMLRTWDTRDAERMRLVHDALLAPQALGFDDERRLIRLLDRERTVIEIEASTCSSRAVGSLTHSGDAHARWISDGTHFLEVLPDGSFHLHNVTDGSERQWRETFAEGAVASCVSMSDDARFAAVGFENGSALVEDLERGVCTARTGPMSQARPQKVQCCTFAPDARLLAIGSEGGMIRLVDCASGHATVLRAEPPGEGSESRSEAIAFAPDGATLAASGTEGCVDVWDVPSRRKTMSLVTEPAHILAIAFAHDGTRLATGGANGAIVLWDMETGAQVLSMRFSTFPVRRLLFGPADDSLLVVERGRSVGLVRALPRSDATPSSRAATTTRPERGQE